VCPTQAIVFGDLSDARSQVAQAKASARHYVMLGELNTRPRTSYLARVRNPNPSLEQG
jgi:Fe-S-cluster-containing dehydrogenase component